MLYVFAGLPGTGKTTIAKILAKKTQAAYLRIDSIEQTIVNSDVVTMENLGPYGYFVAYAVASDNLELGLSVIADSVNPLKITRDAWFNIARKSGVPCLEVEIICSDLREHQRRVEERLSDIPGLVLPDWQAVLDRKYEPWERERLVIDTACCSPDEAVDAILGRGN